MERLQDRSKRENPETRICSLCPWTPRNLAILPLARPFDRWPESLMVLIHRPERVTKCTWIATAIALRLPLATSYEC